MYNTNSNNQMQIFNFEDREVRTMQSKDKIYFNLNDVCNILEIKNPSDAKNRLKKDGLGTTEVIDNLGRKQEASFIDEPNLYRLIFQSRKEEAEKFQDWVTSEVLPSIRKHGAYMTSETIEKTLSDPDFIIKIATQLKKENEARAKAEQELMQANNVLQEQAPKIEFYDAILSVDNVLNTTTLAKELGITGAKRLNPILIDMRLQYLDRRGEYRPTEEAMKKEIAFLREHIVQCKVRFQLCWKMQAVELIRSKLIRKFGEDYAKIINSSKVGELKRKGEAS